MQTHGSWPSGGAPFAFAKIGGAHAKNWCGGRGRRAYARPHQRWAAHPMLGGQFTPGLRGSTSANPASALFVTKFQNKVTSYNSCDWARRDFLRILHVKICIGEILYLKLLVNSEYIFKIAIIYSVKFELFECHWQKYCVFRRIQHESCARKTIAWRLSWKWLTKFIPENIQYHLRNCDS